MATSSKNNSKKWKKMLPGLFLILLGVIFLLNNFGFTSFNFSNLWPIFLIIPGIYMVMGLHDRD